MSFAIRTAWPQDLPNLVAIAVEAQSDPERFSCYVGDEPASISADVSEVVGVEPDTDWTSVTWLALDDDRNVVGWLLVETDPEMARGWLWGPFMTDRPADVSDPVMDQLLATATRALPSITDFELGADQRSVRLAAFADRHGLVPEEGSVLLRTAGIEPPTLPARTGERAVVDLGELHRDAVVGLHDRLFPGTHTTGPALVQSDDDRKVRLVIEGDRPGNVLGYVATELDSDGSVYVDYLGVDEAQRGSGLGRALVVEGLRRGQLAGASHAHLTVREGNASARALYRSIGFVEERLITPYRRGFSLT